MQGDRNREYKDAKPNDWAERPRSRGTDLFVSERLSSLPPKNKLPDLLREGCSALPKLWKLMLLADSIPFNMDCIFVSILAKRC